MAFLAFSQPRGMSAVSFTSIVASVMSAVLTLVLWERGQLRAEQNINIRICDNAILLMVASRMLELGS